MFIKYIKAAVTRSIRNSHTFAFCQGFYERYRWHDGFGRSHPIDADWDDAYNRGANLSDAFTGNYPEF